MHVTSDEGDESFLVVSSSFLHTSSHNVDTVRAGVSCHGVCLCRSHVMHFIPLTWHDVHKQNATGQHQWSLLFGIWCPVYKSRRFHDRYGQYTHIYSCGAYTIKAKPCALSLCAYSSAMDEQKALDWSPRPRRPLILDEIENDAFSVRRCWGGWLGGPCLHTPVSLYIVGPCSAPVPGRVNGCAHGVVGSTVGLPVLMSSSTDGRLLSGFYSLLSGYSLEVTWIAPPSALLC